MSGNSFFGGVGILFYDEFGIEYLKYINFLAAQGLEGTCSINSSRFGHMASLFTARSICHYLIVDKKVAFKCYFSASQTKFKM